MIDLSKANGAYVRNPQSRFARESLDMSQLDSRSWYGSAHVCDSQGMLPACFGYAVANVLEHILTVEGLLKKVEQLDGEAIWRRAREMFWAGNYEGGLFPVQAIAACVDLNLLPESAEYVEVKGWAAINAELAKAPLLQAHHVHAGWQSPDPESGCLDHDPSPTFNDGWHETVLVGMGVKSNKTFMHCQNSWGQAWGRYGFFVMTTEEYLEGEAEVGRIELPEGWWEFSDWRNFVRGNE